jgi:hypothetical protein
VVAFLPKSSRSESPDKPRKPYRDLPLFRHATRRWAKEIRGKLHYFGPWSDLDAALEKYLAQRNDLHAGRVPRETGDGLTVKDLCNMFLTDRQNLVAMGETTRRCTGSDCSYGSALDLLSPPGMLQAGTPYHLTAVFEPGARQEIHLNGVRVRDQGSGTVPGGIYDSTAWTGRARPPSCGPLSLGKAIFTTST